MKTNKHLIISSIIFTIMLILWPVFMAVSRPSGTIEDHFKWITENIVLYKIQFFLAFLLIPSVIYLMVSQLSKFTFENKSFIRFGYVFLAAYSVLNSISYASQIAFLPKLINAGLIEQAKIWYFESPVSFTYFINQMGYCLWGIGTIILFFKLIYEKGLIKYISIIYIISSVLSIIAFIGLIIENDIVNSMTLYGGLVLLPLAIMSIIWGIKENKRI